MYKIDNPMQLTLAGFNIPFNGKLDEQNRWVQLAKLIPWDDVENEYKTSFTQDKGAPAIKSRIAFGSLIIKEKCQYTDRETVLQISENPYLQYFLGFKDFNHEAPFDPSMMVHFRKRFGEDALGRLNELIIAKSNKNSSSKNRGKILLDASCTPADIRYPSDVSILNEARVKTEKIIDTLYRQIKGIIPKSKFRTYRQKARKLFLGFIKKKRKGYKEIRKALRKQLNFINRNLKHIETLIDKGASLSVLSNIDYRNLLVVREVYRQQLEMYTSKSKKIIGRIVSIFQPHVRPIVRGKAGAKVEFGAKVSFSIVDGFTRVEKTSWENYNEGIYLIETIENYKLREGVYPASVHVDQIYLNRENRKFCRDNDIRISGKALGRPKADKELAKEERDQYIQDLKDRVAIEGKFGEAKRRYGLDRVMAKLPETSLTVIGLCVIIMNLEKGIRLFCDWLFYPINKFFNKFLMYKLEIY